MERPLVTTEEAAPIAPPARILLRPRSTPARVGNHYQCLYDYRMVASIIRAANASTYLAIDFETKGGDYSDDIEIVGLGLAWDSGSCYFHWSDLSWTNRQKLLNHLLLTHPGLLAHNVYFDGGVIRKLYGQHPDWKACTLALYMMLSNEGYAGQQWGLKAAQTDILQWESSNETELDEWLITNGFYKGNRRNDNSPEHLLACAREGTLSPDKGEMWRAPREILGKYCVLDAEACYLLFTEHLLPVALEFQQFYDWFQVKWMTHIRIHIEQKLNGIYVDRPGLLGRREHLTGELTHIEGQIRNHPDLLPHIQKIEEELLQELIEREPEQYKKLKVRPPEPPRFTKAGSQSKSWEAWVRNASKYEPQISLNWVNWKNRLEAAMRMESPEYRYNIKSGPQNQKLFYQHLQFPVRVLTEKQQPATGIKALKHFGDFGKLYIDLAWDEKELSYINDYLERTENRPTIHPSFRLPGTKTGRLSSKDPNLQQVPKSKAVMSLFQAKPGHVWVDLDFSALEPVVATEFSNDPNMMLIYADGRPPNDIYLFVAAHIPGIREKVRAAGYDPVNPTKEGISSAKKACKHERSICKTVTLACQYGAGVNKVMQTLEQDDVFLEREEVEKIWSTYWDLFGELKRFGYDLQNQLKRNGGYVLNGLGRPMCVTEDYRHDVLNRFIQSTGHDILVEYCYILEEILNYREVPWSPVVWDWHDAVTIEVPEGREGDAERCFLESLRILNEQLGGTIKLKGTPCVGRTLADVKEPEE